MYFKKWSICFHKAIPRSRAILLKKLVFLCKKVALLVEDLDSIPFLLQTPPVIVHIKSDSQLHT